MSAVAETKTSIAFIGVGETPNDLERFEADRFISRLLGMGISKPLWRGPRRFKQMRKWTSSP